VVTGSQDGGKPSAKAENMRIKSALRYSGISGAFGLFRRKSFMSMPFNRIMTMTMMVTSRGQRLDRRFLYPIFAMAPLPDQSCRPVPGRRELSLAASEVFCQQASCTGG
jgi:hypothetical protein